MREDDDISVGELLPRAAAEPVPDPSDAQAIDLYNAIVRRT